MKGFEADDWIARKSSREDMRWVYHNKFTFIEIDCKKKQKGLKSLGYNDPPVWSLELRAWNLRGVKYEKIFKSRFNKKMVEDFFNEFLKSNTGKHIIFNCLFESNLKQRLKV